MASLLAVPMSILVTAFCWGVYGVVLHVGQHEMLESRLRPFICVGLAYFLLGVLLPLIWLYLNGEKGKWTATGTIWSLIAGAVGALGALGVILALTFGGRPVYVMPLVFGCAPAINTFTTMYMGRSFRANPMFLAGLILVIAGAAMVLIFKPAPQTAAAAQIAAELGFMDWLKIAGAIALTVVSWGVYGPVLHKGQMAMQGSRLRPLICVGIAYLVIAVVLPLLLMPLVNDPGEWTFKGTLWSLAGGAAGAVGAIGIILAFNFGGKPIYVMPLVFGGAPVINTFASMTAGGGGGELTPWFIAGLIIAIIGAVTVLVFAPRGQPHGHSPATPAPKPAGESIEPVKT
jgi:drug/metabolite transporter (DMT)-like permease